MESAHTISNERGLILSDVKLKYDTYLRALMQLVDENTQKYAQITEKLQEEVQELRKSSSREKSHVEDLKSVLSDLTKKNAFVTIPFLHCFIIQNPFLLTPWIDLPCMDPRLCSVMIIQFQTENI
jgi:hypothetical protein